VAAGDEVQRGGSGERGGRVVDQIWGDGEEGAHRSGLHVAEGIDGGERALTSWSRGRR
jgi:hypothetical protein